MQLDAFLGNELVVASLKTALLGGKLSHAVLLTGADGCGRGLAARLLAADYLFPHLGDAKAGDNVPTAADINAAKLRAAGAAAVLRGEGSEVLLVQGEGASGRIPVDRIRAVRQDVFRSALSAAGRVVIVKDAHRMAAPAYNALLKVLEEPPRDVLFILTAPDAASMPLTIQSRCSIYSLAPLAVEVCEAALKKALPDGEDAALPALLATIYTGRLGAGMAVLKNPELLAVLRDALALAAACAAPAGADRYTLLRVFSGYEGRAEGDREKRAALLADFTDVLSACIHNVGSKAQMLGFASMPRRSAMRLMEHVLTARQALGGNVAPKISFAALAVRLASVK